MSNEKNVEAEPSSSKEMSLSIKKLRAIRCLLSSRTKAEAAKAAKISERTLYLYYKDPVFVAALRDAEQDIMDGTTRRLVAGNPTALDAVQKLIGGAKSEAIQLQAAMSWMNLSYKVLDPRNVDKRLSALEKRAMDDVREKDPVVENLLKELSGYT